MNIGIEQIVLLITTIAGLFTSLFYSRKAKRAEVRAQEIDNADKMVELVKKANEEAAAIQKRMIVALQAEYERIVGVCDEQKKLNKELKHENEKFRKTAEKLERALKSIVRCPYSDKCPVLDELQDRENYHGLPGTNKPDRNHSGSTPGYGGRDSPGQCPDKSATGMRQPGSGKPEKDT